MTTGLEVVFAVLAGTAPTGLVNTTHYFVINVDTNTIKLATTLNNANNGVAIAIADNNDAVGGGSFSLTAVTLSVVVKLQCSNDGENFSDISGKTHTFTGDGSILWDLGTPFYRILRTVFTPASGEADITLTFNALNLS